MLQLRIHMLHATTKTWCSQINKYLKRKGKNIGVTFKFTKKKIMSQYPITQRQPLINDAVFQASLRSSHTYKSHIHYVLWLHFMPYSFYTL